MGVYINPFSLLLNKIFLILNSILLTNINLSIFIITIDTLYINKNVFILLNYSVFNEFNNLLIRFIDIFTFEIYFFHSILNCIMLFLL